MTALNNIIVELSGKELVALFNRLSPIQLTKFKDLNSGQSRLHGLALSNQSGLLQAMYDLKIHVDLAEKLEKELEKASKKAPAPVLPALPVAEKKEPTPKSSRKEPQAPVASEAVGNQAIQPSQETQAQAPASKETQAQVDFSTAWDAIAQPLLAMQAAEKAKEVAVVGELPAKASKPQTKGLRAFTVLWYLQNIIKEQRAVGVDEVTTSAELAKRSGFGTKEVNKQLEWLKTTELLELEDDTTANDEVFYYVNILPKGFATDCAPYLEQRKAAAAAPRATGTPAAPRGNNAGKHIFRLVEANPRKEGSWGWKSFNLAVTGISYEDYIKAGGRPQDLAWDVDHKFVEVK